MDDDTDNDDDWDEDDDDAAQEEQQTMCLFDDVMLSSVEGAVEHMRVEHGFCLREIRREYGTVDRVCGGGLLVTKEKHRVRSIRHNPAHQLHPHAHTHTNLHLVLTQFRHLARTDGPLSRNGPSFDRGSGAGERVLE